MADCTFAWITGRLDSPSNMHTTQAGQLIINNSEWFPLGSLESGIGLLRCHACFTCKQLGPLSVKQFDATTVAHHGLAFRQSVRQSYQSSSLGVCLLVFPFWASSLPSIQLHSNWWLKDKQKQPKKNPQASNIIIIITFLGRTGQEDSTALISKKDRQEKDETRKEKHSDSRQRLQHRKTIVWRKNNSRWTNWRLSMYVKNVATCFSLTSGMLYAPHIVDSCGYIFICCFGKGWPPGQNFIIKRNESKVVLLVEIVQDGLQSFSGLQKWQNVCTWYASYRCF